MSRRELEARARRIADAWLAEANAPLSPRDAGAVIASLAREAARAWDDHFWEFTSAHQCVLGVVRRYWLDVPWEVWRMLSAWTLLDICGAVRR